MAGKNGTKKHAVARVTKESAAMQRAVAAMDALEQGAVKKFDLLEQRFELVARQQADLGRLDQKLDALREVLASGAGVTDQREEHFLRRLRAMEAYGRGEDGPDSEWVERDMAETAAPRGALSVASAFGVNRELIEQVYGQYQVAYERAFKRWLEKYPDGVRDCTRCFACGQLKPGTKPRPLPEMERR